LSIRQACKAFRQGRGDKAFRLGKRRRALFANGFISAKYARIGSGVSAGRRVMMRHQYADDSLVVHVGMRIRKLRLERRMTLRDFGKCAGVHPFHVMAIELGQLATTTKTLQSIANALDVAPLDLLNHDPDNDDLGHVIELMRKHPDCIRKIMFKVKQLVAN